MHPRLEKTLASALPANVKLMGGFPVERSIFSTTGKDSCDAPKEKRPEVLTEAQSIQGDLRGKIISFFLRLLANDIPIPVESQNDPALRIKRQRQKSSFFGGWDSLAGQWLAAAQPRSKVGVITYVAITESTLQFVYAQAPRSGGEVNGVTELGASFDRASLVWTRQHQSQVGEYLFGFSDGSWGALMGPREESFRRWFPGTLTHKDPIP
ncbi:hypothetical protein ACH4GP_07735 [Streptomyces celluloflavus]|uniref:Uncharacterized protein n=1 Tax=Streptomyces celluloflavus TaxID=58344 RepID=A0ABW7R899_9ACTN